jgi:hypothetical protein
MLKWVNPFLIFNTINTFTRRSQWPCGLRRISAAACRLRSWVWIPPGAWTFVCCECCVLSGRGLCDELIARPEESYRLVRHWMWSRHLNNEEAMTGVGSQRKKKKEYLTRYKHSSLLWPIQRNRPNTGRDLPAAKNSFWCFFKGRYIISSIRNMTPLH